MFRFGGFELDQQRAELRGPDGVAIKLRPKSFDMLTLFARNPSQVLSKQELMEAIWPDIHVGEDGLFQCIREIRSALGDDQRKMVKLVSGRGYLFAAEVSTGAAPVLVAPPKPSSAPMIVPEAQRSRWPFSLRRPAAIVTALVLCTIIGLAVAAPVFRANPIFKRSPPTVAVMPIGDESDPVNAAMAGDITTRMIDGLARIGNIRVVTPRSTPVPEGPGLTPKPSAQADFTIHGELQRGPQAWIFRTRMIETATGEVQSLATVSVDINGVDLQLQQSRLAAGAGHQLAQRLNKLLLNKESSPRSGSLTADSAKVAIEQASASINQTTRERFGVAQTMLQNALLGEPDNVDIAVALAALQLRGIQMVWYAPDEAKAVEAQAGTTLERALRARPDSIPVLETYCRFLSATNRFADSLVACAKALNLDPWNGLALYLVGLGQIHLGRFEDALVTFEQADRFDTPRVSRWTWLLGAGWANAMLERYADALPWLQRSIDITPASGRSHMLLAAVYQDLGRVDEAKAAMKKGLELRPGTTALNVSPPTRNTSPTFVEGSERIIRSMVAAGLPKS